MRQPPIACTLNTGDLAARQRRWRTLADHALMDVATAGDGLLLRFRPGPDVLAELRELAAAERACCAFAQWAVHGDDQASVLRISGGSAAAVTAIHQMLTDLRPSPAGDR